MPTAHAARRSIASRVNQVLSKFGLENAVSGGKFDDLRQHISEATGYWTDTNFATKPSRLVIHFEGSGANVRAFRPAANTNGNFAYANTARRSVGGLFVRILPVVKLAENSYKPAADWEWLLWYCFWPALKNGSSGQLFDGIVPENGTFTYMGSVQKYIAAGLVTLNQGAEEFSFPTSNRLKLTYQQATDALQRLIRVDVAIPAALD